LEVITTTTSKLAVQQSAPLRTAAPQAAVLQIPRTLTSGRWLRQQRQARGWSVPEMRRHLREAAKAAGDTLPSNDCLSVMIHRWEHDRSGMSERYRFHFCRALQVPIEEFGAVLAPASAPPTPRATTDHATAPAADDRHHQASSLGRPSIEQEIRMTAHESNDHAQQAERRDIGEATLEQLRAEVIRLSHEYMTGEPLPLFFEMRRVRDQMYSVIDRKLWPRDQTDLYFLLGCVNSLMADAAEGLGNSAAADELARAGLAYALAIDHRPLAAQLRMIMAVVALWNDQPLRCIDMAKNGLEYLTAGPNAAQLHLMRARGAARLGDAATAAQAIEAANRTRERDYADDLLEIGGDFRFSIATQHYFAGSALTEIVDAQTDAIAELERATELYAAGPEPGEHHSERCKMISQVDLATMRLRAGQLDAAITAAGPVLAVPPSHRIANLAKRFRRVRAELTASRYYGSAQARQLDEQIEQFCRDTIAAHLRELPASTVS
jgi:transcriptional regulator with XRE-family HTH domain